MSGSPSRSRSCALNSRVNSRHRGLRGSTSPRGPTRSSCERLECVRPTSRTFSGKLGGRWGRLRLLLRSRTRSGAEGWLVASPASPAEELGETTPAPPAAPAPTQTPPLGALDPASQKRYDEYVQTTNRLAAQMQGILGQLAEDRQRLADDFGTMAERFRSLPTPGTPPDPKDPKYQ